MCVRIAKIVREKMHMDDFIDKVEKMPAKTFHNT